MDQLEPQQQPSTAEKVRPLAEAETIKPFRVNVPESELINLRQRIEATRWPEQETVSDHTQGVQLNTIQKLARRWLTDYDWRKVETKLNALPRFTTRIDGLDIHFIHVRSKHEYALPLIITHGWPGSVIEQLKIVERLTDPTAHGASALDAFHSVIPSLPGYGFSGKPTTTGWDPPHIARAWIALMKRLGYTKYVAQGCDWGALITDYMGVQAPPELLAIAHQHAGRGSSGRPRRSARRSSRAIGTLGRRTSRVRAFGIFLQARPRLRRRDGEPPTDTLRHCGFTCGVGRLDD